MPYISDIEQTQLLQGDDGPATPGELNFLITKLCLEYLGDNARYSDYNSVVGALECCKLEFYRRAVAPYEDVKIKENGDIY